ncbi:hypothetical protein [Undibacterium sp. Ji22W]|uniref:hypothetical protein n=1 Tax=Undibacterium sp. Ji22W TaxID=3413038 RepID=UPI003BF2A647
MMNQDVLLERWIPYKLQAVETLQFAWEWINETNEVRDLHIIVNGQLKLRGNVATVANPMIEVGLIHARSLLEFLGLCVQNGKLAQIKKRRPDDVAVEDFSTSQYPLTKVDPYTILAAYPGPTQEAEDALIAIFELANKGLAHITKENFSKLWTDQHLDIACRGIPVLLHNRLYAKLGRNIPKAPEAISKLFDA